MGKTHFIFSSGELHRKDNSILFLKNGGGRKYIPIENARELYCLSEVSFNSKFLSFIAKAGITIHFFDYYGHYSGSFYPKENYISGALTVKQAIYYKDNQVKIAKAIVQGIADNIHETLYHYFRHGKKDLKKYLDWLKSYPKKVFLKDLNIKQVLAVEALIWKRFYASFKYFLPNEFIINKRVKRPPDNPINALISFGNSILYTKTISQIYHTHLNQSISFLHEPQKGRFSLSLDLSEVFKPIIVFKTIFDLVNRKKLIVEKHFDKIVNYASLNEDGKKIFVQAFEDRINETFMNAKLKRKVTYKTQIKYEGHKLIKTILEGVDFKPFSIKDKI